MPPVAAEKEVLRDLARRIAQAARDPIQSERTRMWKDFNTLAPHRPMVLAFPEGGWADLVGETELVCAEGPLRGWEMNLRRRVFHIEHIHDDQPITDCFNVSPVLRVSDYGLVETYTRTEQRGSQVWDAPVKTPADLAKLRPRTFEHDAAETDRRMSLAEEIFGDILRVRRRQHLGWPAALSMDAIKLRGLEQVMMDIYDEPNLLGELMAFLRDEALRKLAWLEAEGLLSLNNGPDDYVGSGGLGATDELPAADFDGHVRPKDLWGFGESQEFVLVGPAHWRQFVLEYQLPILEQFGLNHYGCCEPLDAKYDVLFERVPRLRRLSISAWADVALAARTLAGRCVFSWKPAPAMICAPGVNWDAVAKHIRETLAIARGCAIEMVMKDTHTFQGDPTRIERWSEIASRCAREA